jgi:hypothetical protein
MLHESGQVLQVSPKFEDLSSWPVYRQRVFDFNPPVCAVTRAVDVEDIVHDISAPHAAIKKISGSDSQR